MWFSRQSPVKKSSWSGYWDATKDSDICVQGSDEDVIGSEDCLYVSVYAPEVVFSVQYKSVNQLLILYRVLQIWR